DPSTLHPTLVEPAFRLAAATSDTALYAQMRRRFEESKTPADRRRYLGALGYFRDPALVQASLDYSLTGPLRPQERVLGFRFYNSEAIEKLQWAWLQKNYDAFTAKLPSMFRVFMVYFAAGCSNAQVADARVFFSKPEHAPQGTEAELA